MNPDAEYTDDVTSFVDNLPQIFNDPSLTICLDGVNLPQVHVIRVRVELYAKTEAGPNSTPLSRDTVKETFPDRMIEIWESRSVPVDYDFLEKVQVNLFRNAYGYDYYISVQCNVTYPGCLSDVLHATLACLKLHDLHAYVIKSRPLRVVSKMDLGFTFFPDHLKNMHRSMIDDSPEDPSFLLHKRDLHLYFLVDGEAGKIVILGGTTLDDIRCGAKWIYEQCLLAGPEE